MKNLYIFAEARSGSNWLVETLNSHPRMAVLKEILQYSNRKKFYREQGMGYEPFTYGSDVEYLRKRLGALEKEWTGCKILFPHFRCFDFYDFLNHYEGASFIILTRGNSFKAEISGSIARTHGRWHERDKPGELLRVHIDPVCFYRRLEWRRLAKEFIINMLAAYQVRRIDICYEELFKDPGENITKICRFLDLDPREITFSSEMRSNPFSLQQIIKNFDQVRSFFEDYPEYFKMLEAGME